MSGGRPFHPASWLHKRAKRGFRGYPIATIAFYRPTAELATKVVVSIVRDEGHEPDPLERWFPIQQPTSLITTSNMRKGSVV